MTAHRTAHWRQRYYLSDHFNGFNTFPDVFDSQKRLEVSRSEFIWPCRKRKPYRSMNRTEFNKPLSTCFDYIWYYKRILSISRNVCGQKRFLQKMRVAPAAVRQPLLVLCSSSLTLTAFSKGSSQSQGIWLAKFATRLQNQIFFNPFRCATCMTDRETSIYQIQTAGLMRGSKISIEQKICLQTQIAWRKIKGQNFPIERIPFKLGDTRRWTLIGGVHHVHPNSSLSILVLHELPVIHYGLNPSTPMYRLYQRLIHAHFNLSWTSAQTPPVSNPSPPPSFAP